MSLHRSPSQAITRQQMPGIRRAYETERSNAEMCETQSGTRARLPVYMHRLRTPKRASLYVHTGSQKRHVFSVF